MLNKILRGYVILKAVPIVLLSMYVGYESNFNLQVFLIWVAAIAILALYMGQFHIVVEEDIAPFKGLVIALTSVVFLACIWGGIYSPDIYVRAAQSFFCIGEGGLLIKFYLLHTKNKERS